MSLYHSQTGPLSSSSAPNRQLFEWTCVMGGCGCLYGICCVLQSMSDERTRRLSGAESQGEEMKAVFSVYVLFFSFAKNNKKGALLTGGCMFIHWSIFSSVSVLHKIKAQYSIYCPISSGLFSTDSCEKICLFLLMFTRSSLTESVCVCLQFGALQVVSCEFSELVWRH